MATTGLLALAAGIVFIVGGAVNDFGFFSLGSSVVMEIGVGMGIGPVCVIVAGTIFLIASISRRWLFKAEEPTLSN